ncbi:MAG: hypothetical protein JO027_01440, partial [Solirubrobacterales bacterium]|nr:hypothetical protein [Solirubrobacterales bacterium]
GCAAGSARSQLLAGGVISLPGKRVYGCAGRGCRLIEVIRLVGADVGFIVEHHGLDTVDGTLTVRDLADDRGLHTVQAHTVIGYGERLITYVIAPSGNIAWATDTTSPGPQGNFRHIGTIRRAIGQTVTTLDSGSNVRPGSLRRRGDTAQWIDGGRQQAAPLP